MRTSEMSGRWRDIPAPLLTRAEVATILRVTPRKVSELRAKGLLKGSDVAGSASPNGHRLRFRRAEVERYIDATSRA